MSERSNPRSVPGVGSFLTCPKLVRCDDFFVTIGGQSIAAVQLAQRIAKQYQVRLKLSSILKARTMRAIAHSVNLAAAGSVATWSPVVSIRSRGSKPPIFLIAGVGGTSSISSCWLAFWGGPAGLWRRDGRVE